MSTVKYASRSSAAFALAAFERLLSSLKTPWPPGALRDVALVQEFLRLAGPALPTVESCRRADRRKQLKQQPRQR